MCVLICVPTQLQARGSERGSPGEGKQDGEELRREAHRSVHKTAVEVDVGVEPALGIPWGGSLMNNIRGPKITYSGIGIINNIPFGVIWSFKHGIKPVPVQSTRLIGPHPAMPWQSRSWDLDQ